MTRFILGCEKKKRKKERVYRQFLDARYDGLNVVEVRVLTCRVRRAVDDDVDLHLDSGALLLGSQLVVPGEAIGRIRHLIGPTRCGRCDRSDRQEILR